jgi:hypothetical protein
MILHCIIDSLPKIGLLLVCRPVIAVGFQKDLIKFREEFSERLIILAHLTQLAVCLVPLGTIAEGNVKMIKEPFYCECRLILMSLHLQMDAGSCLSFK